MDKISRAIFAIQFYATKKKTHDIKKIKTRKKHKKIKKKIYRRFCFAGQKAHTVKNIYIFFVFTHTRASCAAIVKKIMQK